MQLFAHASRPVHLGPYPAERLGRSAAAPDLSRIRGDGTLRSDFADEPLHLGNAISDFMCALDAVREGDRNPAHAEIPADPEERARHLKAAGYFLDSSQVGICRLTGEHLLPQRVEHPYLRTTSYEHSEDKLRLRFNPNAVIRQMGHSLGLAGHPIDHHTHAIVFLVEYPPDPAPGEPGAEWIAGLQAWRAARRRAATPPPRPPHIPSPRVHAPRHAAP